MIQTIGLFQPDFDHATSSTVDAKLIPGRRPRQSAGVCGLLVLLLACTSADDRRFAEVQSRGKVAMGVDQYTSAHVFQPLADGGRVELQRNEADSAGRARILAHMEEIATAFRGGNFTVPGFVHAQEVPGTKVMAERRSEIRYSVESLPRGGALRVRTRDSAAVRAIHEFLAFQRQDHRAHGTGAGH